MPPGLQEFLEGITAWAGLLWATFIIGALVLVCRWVVKAWPQLKKLIAVVDALIGLPDFMARARDQLENDHDTNLRHELTEVLDLTKDMSVQIGELTEWQKKHELKSDAAYVRITKLEGER